jgi:isoleucyl-tRNA synthetase
VPKISKVLGEIDGAKAVELFEKGEALVLEIEGEKIELAENDVLVETTEKEGFVSVTDGGITVVIDTNLTPELIEEGFVREMISKIQTMRKEAGFEVEDRIRLFYRGNERIAGIISKNKGIISDEVLANEISEGKFPCGAYSKEWNINGEKAEFAVVRVSP